MMDEGQGPVAPDRRDSKRHWVEDWPVQAACRGMDPDALFVDGPAQDKAKSVCAACPVRTECLADALDNRISFGVWGGMTEQERRALLRRRPDVISWRDVLEGKREAYLVQSRQVLLPTTESETDREKQEPRISRSAICLSELAARLLPRADQERYCEEYLAELYDLRSQPHRIQLMHALRLVSRTWMQRQVLAAAKRRAAAGG